MLEPSLLSGYVIRESNCTPKDFSTVVKYLFKRWTKNFFFIIEMEERRKNYIYLISYVCKENNVIDILNRSICMQSHLVYFPLSLKAKEIDNLSFSF